MVGFSIARMADLDRLLPADDLVILDEPDLIESRRIVERASLFPCVREVVAGPTQDEEGARDWAARQVPFGEVDGVIPGVEYGVVVAAALAEAWSLPGAGVDAALVLRNKARLRKVAEDAGIAQPHWAVALNPEDVTRFRASQSDGTCVLKPTGRQASLGVQLLGPSDDVEEAWNLTKDAEEPFMRSSSHLQSDEFLVEELVRGPEVSVEALVENEVLTFVNITGKFVRAGRHPVELGHAVPAPLSLTVTASLRVAMQALVEATGFVSGAMHAEWILVRGIYPHLVECAGRLPGDGIVPLIDLAYGGDLVSEYLSVLAGRATGAIGKAYRGASVRFLDWDGGEVGEVAGVAEAKALPGVHRVEVTARSGQHLRTTSSWSRVGEVVAVGASGIEAQEIASAAAVMVRVGGTR